MALSAKHKLSCINEKICALYELGIYIGMYGSLRRMSDSLGNKVECEPEIIMAIFIKYLEERILLKKTALGMLLDYFLPDWREIVGIKMLGPIVHRDSKEVRQWKKIVLKRDKCCQMCGHTKNLEIHHIIPWLIAPELRTDIENGKVLCKSCHLKVRKYYG